MSIEPVPLTQQPSSVPRMECVPACQSSPARFSARRTTCATAHELAKGRIPEGLAPDRANARLHWSRTGDRLLDWAAWCFLCRFRQGSDSARESSGVAGLAGQGGVAVSA